MATRQDVIKRFVQDPEWYIMEDLLKQKIERLRLIDDIDDKQTGTDIKAQIKANKRTFSTLNDFLVETGLFKKDKLSSKNPDYK